MATKIDRTIRLYPSDATRMIRLLEDEIVRLEKIGRSSHDPWFREAVQDCKAVVKQLEPISKE